MVLIDLQVAGAPAVFLLLAADGTINRMGTGAEDNQERALMVGLTTPDIFELLMELVTPDLFRYSGEFIQETQQGKSCILTIALTSADGGQWTSRWRYGSQSKGPPQVVCDFVLDAVSSTDPWFGEQQKQLPLPR